MAELDLVNPVYPATVRSNFRAIARGGLSLEFQYLTCYADFTVHEYLLGSSTSANETLTLAYDRRGEARSYELYRQAFDAGEFGNDSILTQGEYEAYLREIAADIETILGAVLENHESVVFLSPMGAHNTIEVEAWQVVAQWELQTDDEGVVNAIRMGLRPITRAIAS